MLKSGPSETRLVRLRMTNPIFEVIHFKSEAHTIEFLRTRSFYKEAGEVFTIEEMSGFLNYIAANPEAGAKIPGTSGLRKMRWRAKGSGKSGGARVIYYFRDLNMPLLLLAVYPKNHIAQLSVKRLREIDRKVEYIVQELASKYNKSQSGQRA